MEIGLQGLNLIKDIEKLRLNAYLDSAGVWTIGYGTTRIGDKPVRPGMKITEFQALSYLHDEANYLGKYITKLVRVPLNQNQFDALISLAYNIGLGGFKGSTLLKRINSEGEITEDLFTRWNKARDPKTGKLRVLNGLTKRRKREFALYMEPIDVPV